MRDFVFHNPTKLIFGRHALGQTGPELSRFGAPALLVYGRGSIMRNGVYRQVVESLQAAGTAFFEHGGVQPNPLLSHVRAGVDLARSRGCRVIVGIGGGSALDSAKAIAAGVPAPHDVWKFFTGKKSVREALPVVCVPTLAGSGSDLNGGMVLTHDDQGLKFGFAHRRLFPRVSIVDPAVTCSVSAAQTAYGAVDTMCHCLEAYFSTLAEGALLQRRILEDICRTSLETCLRLQTAPDSYDDRATMFWAASLALSGMATAGLGRLGFPLHLIEHAVSAYLDVPHGAGLAAILPGWLNFHHSTLAARLGRLGAALFDLSTGTEMEISVQAIDGLKQFLVTAGCPTSIRELGVGPHHFSRIAEHCSRQARVWRMSDYPPEKVIAILEHCLSD